MTSRFCAFDSGVWSRAPRVNFAAERLCDAAPRLHPQLGKLLLIGDPGAAPAMHLPARHEPDREADGDDREADSGDNKVRRLRLHPCVNLRHCGSFTSCWRNPDVNVVVVVDGRAPEDLRLPVVASR
jgi:hypothetical protein